MGLKFIKLFEEYSDMATSDSSNSSISWNQVRDIIQMKKPFMIIVFKNKDSYLDALHNYLNTFEYAKQVGVMKRDGKTIKYPSIFISLGEESNYPSEIKKLYEKFKIKQVIVGKSNSEYSTMYSSDGSSSDFGNEIMSTNNIDEVSTEDYFKIGSTYYRFIDFAN